MSKGLQKPTVRVPPVFRASVYGAVRDISAIPHPRAPTFYTAVLPNIVSASSASR